MVTKMLKRKSTLTLWNRLKTTTCWSSLVSGIHQKFNPDHVKAFYYCVEISSKGTHCQSDRKFIKFIVVNFKIVFELNNKGTEVCLSKAPNFDRAQFVKEICRTFLRGPLGFVNFNISQMKCAMRMLHWVAVKVLYKKTRNLARSYEHDLFLMWILLTQKKVKWVEFILDQMSICRNSPRRPLFYTSFLKYLLDSDNITDIPDDMLEGPKVFDSSVVKLMRCYKYQDGS